MNIIEKSNINYDILIQENISILKRIKFLQINLLQLSFKSNDKLNRLAIYQKLMESLSLAQRTLLVNKRIQKEVDVFNRENS